MKKDLEQINVCENSSSLLNELNLQFIEEAAVHLNVPKHIVTALEAHFQKKTSISAQDLRQILASDAGEI